MTTLDSLRRSGSLPPPFIVPQGEEPVTPESRSARSSSHLGHVSARPQSLPTGDTVSEQSTVVTTDDARCGFTAAITAQPPPCSTAHSNMQSIPAACQQLCVQVRKRKVTAEDRSNSASLTPLPDASAQWHDSDSTVTLQLKQQKKETGMHYTKALPSVKIATVKYQDVHIGRSDTSSTLGSDGL